MTNVRNHSYLMVKIIPFILDPYRSPQSSAPPPPPARGQGEAPSQVEVLYTHDDHPPGGLIETPPPRCIR